jgi:polyhydroxybutyrate depolymerase
MEKLAVALVGMMVATACGESPGTMAPVIDAGQDETLEARGDGADAAPSAADSADGAAQQCTVMAGGLMGNGVLPCVGVTRTIQDRPYCVHAPTTPSTDLPLVLLLHGYTFDGQLQARYFGLDDLVDGRGFILAKPNGEMDALGQRYWNAFPACCATAAAAPPDDVAFLTAVLDDLVQAFAVDLKRVYVLGFSNGGFMAHRLACDLSHRIAAVVSVAGAVDPTLCHPTDPMSVVELHGTADELIHYGGGTTLGNTVPYVSVDQTMSFWVDAEHCQQSSSSKGLVDMVCTGADGMSASGAETTILSYPGCASGVSVEHWKMDGAGHVADFYVPRLGDAVVDFLYLHPKP